MYTPHNLPDILSRVYACMCIYTRVCACTCVCAFVCVCILAKMIIHIPLTIDSRRPQTANMPHTYIYLYLYTCIQRTQTHIYTHAYSQFLTVSHTHKYYCRLTLGGCPSANRTYATYGSPITADVSVRVCERKRRRKSTL